MKNRKQNKAKCIVNEGEGNRVEQAGLPITSQRHSRTQ